MSTTQDTAALAAASGLSIADTAWWLPRLPAGLDEAGIAEKLRQIATIDDVAAPLAVTIARRPSRRGVPWSAERRARFESKRQGKAGK